MVMKNYLAISKYVLLAVCFSLMVACKKSSDSGAQSTPAPTNVCANGQTSGGYICQNGVPTTNINAGNANLLNNITFQTSYLQGVMNLGGTANGMIDFNNPAVISYYAGQVVITGTLQVTNSNSVCNAPAGNYTLNGTAMSQYGVLQAVQMTATGPAQLVLSGGMTASELYNQTGNGLYRNSTGNRIGLNVNLTVNGMPCGLVSTY